MEFPVGKNRVRTSPWTSTHVGSVGASEASPNGWFSGRALIVFGRDQGFPSTVDIAALDGSNGFAVNGVDKHDRAGVQVAAAGDLNADGVDDLVIGAPKFSDHQPGEAYVIFGRRALPEPPMPRRKPKCGLDGFGGLVLLAAAKRLRRRDEKSQRV